MKFAVKLAMRISVAAARAAKWYKPVDPYYGPQNALLMVLMLTGLDGVAKPALAVRPGR
jgi:hypothetical protein